MLEQALTHRSASAKNNERLEFLGDSILNFTIADQLYQRRPDLAEGDLSRLRAQLVKGETLGHIAKEIGLSEYLLLGIGERKSGGSRRRSIQADCVEALLGAVYLESGIDAVREVLARLFQSRLENLPHVDDLKDPKTRIQEWLQGRGMAIPDYVLIETTGQAHEQEFLVECRVAGHEATRGLGTSRRKAEQVAAKAQLAALISAAEQATALKKTNNNRS